MERLRHKGEGVLLIYDNAPDAAALHEYLPRGGTARMLVTSNAHAWRGVAAPVEIRLWPKEIGADYLIARTGRDRERATAESLSEALCGLPLAHEQAAAYCERLDISLGEYGRRFAATPGRLLDDERHAPAEYHDGLTVAKTFALAIEEATKLHPGAEPLIVHAALPAHEPIPLFLFAEARAHTHGTTQDRPLFRKQPMWKQSNSSTSNVTLWAFLVRLGMLAMLVIGGGKIALSQPRPGGDPANPLSGTGSLPDDIFIYPAQGAPRGCGENCSDWLAAEGRVYWDGYKRIIAGLDRFANRKRPVFLNVRGQSDLGVAVSVGRILRDRGIEVGVGQTIVDRCRDLGEPDCLALKRSGVSLHASLRQPVRSVPVRFVYTRAARVRSAPGRFALQRYSRRSALRRFAPPRSGRMSGFSARHTFQAATSFLSNATCS
jgi:hypothetical protein